MGTGTGTVGRSSRVEVCKRAGKPVGRWAGGTVHRPQPAPASTLKSTGLSGPVVGRLGGIVVAFI